MNTRIPKIADRDRLMSRPIGEKLPTPLEPNSPEARHQGVDPKPVPPTGQGDPDAVDPSPKDVGRPA